MTQEHKDKLKKFTEDPDWILVQQLFEEKIQPLMDVMSINSELTNDQIASEVRGRQITIESLSSFLRDSKILSSSNITSNKQTSFR